MLLALPGDSIALQCQIAGHGVRLGFSGAMPTDGYHFLSFPEICLCLLVLTTWGLALGMFLEHTQSIFSLPILANTTNWAQEVPEKELCLISPFKDSGGSSQDFACVSSLLLPSFFSP